MNNTTMKEGAQELHRGHMVLRTVFRCLAHQLHNTAKFVALRLQRKLNQGCKTENCIHMLCRLMMTDITVKC